MSNVVQLPGRAGSWQATGRGHAIGAFMDVRDGQAVQEVATKCAGALMEDLASSVSEDERIALLSGVVAMFIELTSPGRKA